MAATIDWCFVGARIMSGFGAFARPTDGVSIQVLAFCSACQFMTIAWCLPAAMSLQFDGNLEQVRRPRQLTDRIWSVKVTPGGSWLVNCHSAWPKSAGSNKKNC
jgi:hypothetical protein